MARSEPAEHIQQTIDRVPTGNWGSARTGCACGPANFKDGEQVCEWTTYDKTGAVYKVATMAPKTPKASV
jgi:hypothetical protein